MTAPNSTKGIFPLDKPDLLKAYRTMRTIREFEERLHADFAKGVDVRSMMSEIFGKADGACKGKGGSMHIADLSKGMMGANGILGAGAPLICGAAAIAAWYCSART